MRIVGRAGLPGNPKHPTPILHFPQAHAGGRQVRHRFQPGHPIKRRQLRASAVPAVRPFDGAGGTVLQFRCRQHLRGVPMHPDRRRLDAPDEVAGRQSQEHSHGARNDERRRHRRGEPQHLSAHLLNPGPLGRHEIQQGNRTRAPGGRHRRANGSPGRSHRAAGLAFARLRRPRRGDGHGDIGQAACQPFHERGNLFGAVCRGLDPHAGRLALETAPAIFDRPLRLDEKAFQVVGRRGRSPASHFDRANQERPVPFGDEEFGRIASEVHKHRGRRVFLRFVSGHRPRRRQRVRFHVADADAGAVEGLKEAGDFLGSARRCQVNLTPGVAFAVRRGLPDDLPILVNGIAGDTVLKGPFRLFRRCRREFHDARNGSAAAHRDEHPERSGPPEPQPLQQAPDGFGNRVGVGEHAIGERAGRKRLGRGPANEWAPVVDRQLDGLDGACVHRNSNCRVIRHQKPSSLTVASRHHTTRTGYGASMGGPATTSWAWTARVKPAALPTELTVTTGSALSIFV